MADRRKRRRIPEENRIVLDFYPFAWEPDHPKDNFTLTRDISIEGVRIMSKWPFPVGAVLRLNLALSRSRQLVHIDGQVKWVNEVYDGEMFEIGVEFIHKISETVVCLIKHLYGAGQTLQSEKSASCK
jgi:hypothetical protein